MRKFRHISKKAAADQHGLFQHFQVDSTDYATRDKYLSMRGGDVSPGRDTESLYGVFPEGEDSRVLTEYVAPHLSTRYSPDRVGIQAQRVSDGVYQDPYTNKVYDYNEGFKTEDGRDFPGGSASLQSSLMRVANTLDSCGLYKEASQIDEVLSQVGDLDIGSSDSDPEEGRCVSFEIKDILKALFESHEDANSSYKLSPNRIVEIDQCNLTEDELGIVNSSKPSEALEGLSEVLTAAANRLDEEGLVVSANKLDSVLYSVEDFRPRKENFDTNQLINLASSLDDAGEYAFADFLDSYIRKKARR